MRIEKKTHDNGDKGFDLIWLLKFISFYLVTSQLFKARLLIQSLGKFCFDMKINCCFYLYGIKTKM